MILTLTVNPALDKSSSVTQVVPDNKLQCRPPNYDPGGGGINVARVIKRLGGDPLALFQASGPAGNLLQSLLQEEGVNTTTYDTAAWTRENFVVVDESTKQQYRFGMQGPTYTIDEVQQCQQLVYETAKDLEFLVLSGSLAPGMPADFYADICRWAKNNGIKVILDTSGEALPEGLKEGVHLIKPNLRELSLLAGRESISGLEQEDIAMQFVQEGKAEIIVVSLGPRGAMMASKEGIHYVTPPTIVPKSTVGAGDSMVAGMTWALSNKLPLKTTLQYGVACGTAATMNEGTGLCKVEDIKLIYNWLVKQ
ncbi:MAG: 1-phosphofructokinase family hexose kinase [Flammeovirgaceae bacterium]